MISKFIAALLLINSVLAQASESDSLADKLVDQSLLSLAEGNNKKALQIWYMSNAIEEQISPERKEAFIAPTWLAIDRLDLCPVNMPLDPSQYGVTPIALHNYFVRHHRRSPRKRKLPDHSLNTFEQNRQVRPISLSTVLAPEEIRDLKPHRGECAAVAKLFTKELGESSEKNANVDAAFVLRELIEQAEESERVHEDLKRYLAYRKKLVDIYITQELGADSEPDEDKEDILKWEEQFLRLITVDENKWHQLPLADKKVALSLLYRAQTIKKPVRLQLFKKFLDFELARPPSQLLYQLIGYINQGKESAEFVSSEQTKRIIKSAPAHNFPDAAAFSGRLGVKAFRAGDAPRALEYFAEAIKISRDSTSSAEYNISSVDWIRYVMRQYRFDRRLVSLLHSYLPRSSYNSIVHSLLWSAGFHGEPFVFTDKGKKTLKDLSGRSRKLAGELRLLATNKHTAFSREVRERFRNQPTSGLRFMTEFVERLSEEPLPIIKRNRAILKSFRKNLESSERRRRKSFIAKVQKLDNIIDELLRSFEAENSQASDRRLGKGRRVNLGAMYLEPSKPWPWPFPVPDVAEVYVFRPISLKVKKEDSHFVYYVSTEDSQF